MAKKKKLKQIDLFGLLKKPSEASLPPADPNPLPVDSPLQQAGEVFAQMTVDQWINDAKSPVTLKFNSPHGEFYFTKSRKAAARLAEDEKAVFTPLQIERFIKAGLFIRSQLAEELEREADLLEAPAHDESDLLRRAQLMKSLPDDLDVSINEFLSKEFDTVLKFEKNFPGSKTNNITIENNIDMSTFAGDGND